MRIDGVEVVVGCGQIVVGGRRRLYVLVYQSDDAWSFQGLHNLTELDQIQSRRTTRPTLLMTYIHTYTYIHTVREI